MAVAKGLALNPAKAAQSLANDLKRPEFREEIHSRLTEARRLIEQFGHRFESK